MAVGQNELEIEARLATEQVNAGIQDLKDQLAQAGKDIEALGEKTEAATQGMASSFGDLSDAFIGAFLGSGGVDYLVKALETGLDLWHEHQHAAELTAAAYEKASDALEGYFDKLERRREMGEDPVIRPNASQRETIGELGALGAGYSAGPVTRWFQGFWNNLIGKDDSALRGQQGQDMFTFGSVISQGRRDLKTQERDAEAARDEEAKERVREFRQKEADDKRAAQDREKEAREAEREAAREQREAEREAAREQRAFERQLDVALRFQSNRRVGKGLGGDDDKEFRSTMMTDAMEVSRSLMTAGFSSPHEQKMEAFQEKALAQQEKTNEINADIRQNGRDILNKFEKGDIGGLA